MSWRRGVYTGLLFLLLPYVIFHLLSRARRQPEYLLHWQERFGLYSIRSLRPVIWLHTVSVGETRAAALLISALQTHYPDHQILLTHMTPTGRDAGEQLYGSDVLRCYLPYDYPFAVSRFLRHFRPQLGLLLETEIWPNLIQSCSDSGVPLCLLNARLSEKSARGYARFGKLAQTSLRQLALVAAQTEDDAQRLAALGAICVNVMGNLKFDITPAADAFESGAALRETFGAGRVVFLAASTREGEEEKILDALQTINVPGLLSIIVPRHPQRFDAVANLLEQRGVQYQRRSAGQAIIPGTAVVLGDSMGEMFVYYAACDVALIGGTLLPYGGQNLIEACAMGKPVLIGPHTFNFFEVAERAVTAGAALRVADEVELARELGLLLQDSARCHAMGQAGLSFSHQHQGATGRAMVLLQRFIPGSPLTSATD